MLTHQPKSTLFPYTTLFRSLYSGLAPGVAGRYQVTVRVPLLVSPATNISVSLLIDGFASNRVTIPVRDRKSTRLNSSHVRISYAVFCLKKIILRLLMN